jgi:hypothetical protein
VKYPGLRRRQNAFYYDTGGKPRRWIALGSDEAAAMKRYAELRAEKKAVKPESEAEPQRPPVIEAYDPADAIRIYGKGPWSDQGISARKWSEDNWESLYVPAVELWARRTPTNWVRTIESGIYFLYADVGELLYIGLSTAIGNRIDSHIRERAFRSRTFLGCRAGN